MKMNMMKVNNIVLLMNIMVYVLCEVFFLSLHIIVVGQKSKLPKMQLSPCKIKKNCLLMNSENNR